MRVDGFRRQVWLNEAGDEIIEAYTVTNMAHGTPLAVAGGACGAPGLFLLPVGDFLIIPHRKVFGIADVRSAERNMVKASPVVRHYTAESVLEGEILDKDDEPAWQQEPIPPLPEIGVVLRRRREPPD
jgi:hypothetical protein